MRITKLLASTSPNGKHGVPLICAETREHLFLKIVHATMVLMLDALKICQKLVYRAPLTVHRQTAPCRGVISAPMSQDDVLPGGNKGVLIVPRREAGPNKAFGSLRPMCDHNQWNFE